METIHANQDELYIAIQKLATNIKKDPADRKTADYFKRRLDNLNQYWSDYQYNHDRLLTEESKSHSYFSGRKYERTEELYISTKAFITQQYQVLLTKMKESQQGESTQEAQGPAWSKQEDLKGRQSPPVEVCSRGTSSKMDDLLKKQASNFRALQRTVAGINLDIMSEKWELKEALRTLQTRWSIIDSIHWELDSELEGANQQYEASYTKYETIYNKLNNAINRKLGSVVHKENWTPKIDIPFFSGNYKNWVSFKDLFVEAIHNNISLSNAHKMQFLKSKVRGEAERLIQHLQISSDNYTVCWEILNNRYNNTWLIFKSHLDLILNLPEVQHANVHQIKNMHDTTIECLNSIRNLGIEVDSWDPFIVRILLLKLDADTHDHYLETRNMPRDLPKLMEFLSFIESRFTALESSRKKTENSKPPSNKQQKSSALNFTNKNSANKTSGNYVVQTCPLCKESHGIFYCSKFLNMTPNAKRQTVTRLHLCKNCLYSHGDKACISEKRCRECRGKHNTLLHEAFHNKSSCNPITENKTPAVFATRTQKQESQENHVLQQGNNVMETLLATAMIKVQASDGSYHKLRALIDQGSQASLISARAAQQLALSRKYCRAVISGIGEKESSSKGVTSITFCSHFDNFTFQTDVVIMDTLINQLPRRTFVKQTWAHLAGIQLADPEYNVSRPIDILLGADVYANIILEGIIRAHQSLPVAQQTRLGWILCGNLQTFHCNVVLNQVDEVQRFWEIEDITEAPNLSAEDVQCMEYYKKTTTRRENGMYEVRLPFQENFQLQLGLSKNKAVAQFQQLEKKFHNNQELANQYKLFIQEYKTLGHMILSSGNMQPDYYLPHHCVLRNDSTTTALRVVFNASSKTTSGYSLNDVMLKGPNLQQDLQSLILSWRQYRVAFTADIEKMFRFIWLNEQDQKFQKIIWRDTPDMYSQVYQLCTVTYGTKAAPFLAMMTLKQLAEDEKHNFGHIAIKALEQSFYMDDILHGSHSVESAIELKQDLIKLLKSGGFNLRKWSSNASVLQDNTIETSNQQDNFYFKEMETSKTLGLRWNSKADLFTFQSKIEQSTKIPTKRSMLSDISKLFDPLGWLSPLSTKLKLLFQQVWISNIQWDDKLPDQTNKEWLKIKGDMHKINQFKLERWLGTGETNTLELHGFCDSSNKAYACVVYCKTKNDGKIKISLVAGKARLTPVNKSISLPRLELSSALLLAKLMSKIQQCLSNHNIKIYSWTDSMVVLAWLQGEPGKWKPFVANRVRQISSIIPTNSWRYVKSAENPADCASRGLGVDQLKNFSLWWGGPSWLRNNDPGQETEQAVFNTDEEARKIKHINHISQQESDNTLGELLTRYSSLAKLTRVLAWILRFIKQARNKNNRLQGCLTLQELICAKHKFIFYVKKREFAQEIHNLQENKPLSARSKWRHPQQNIQLNDIVTINDANLPPGKWAVGRVVQLHPGADGHTRVVTLKTKNGFIKRPIVKLSILPVNDRVDKQESRLKEVKDRKTNKRVKYSISTLVMLLLSFISIFTTANCSYNVTQLKDNQGLYFDKIANMQLIRDEWKIVTYYDMNSFWQGTAACSKYLAYLDQLCNKLKETSHCDIIQVQLQHEFSELQYYNHLLLSQHSSTRRERHLRRRKRGLINGVGYLANNLFGVLDERFADQYKQDIQSIQDNENHLLSLMKQQTTVIEAEYNVLKRNEQAINKQYKMLNSLSMKLDKLENVLIDESKRNRIMNDFSTGAIATTNVLRHLKTIQTSLLDTITDVYHGKLNFHLLSPEQLKDTLNTISGHLSKDLSLPINNLQDNFRNIYQLLSVKARMTEKYLIFELKLPLISRNLFSIMKIIPIPQAVGNSSMAIVTPIAEYVAINLKKDSYLPMSIYDVQTCLRDDENTYLCHIEKPIYHLKNDEKLCQVEPDTSKCKISFTSCSNQWTTLHKTNNYAFFCCSHCQIRILCNDQVSLGQLVKAGVLGVAHDCLIKTESFTVYSHNEGLSTLDIKPSYKLPEIEPINHIIDVGIPTPLIQNYSLLSSNHELDDIKKQLHILKASENLPYQLSYHDIHHYTALYIVIGVVLVVAVVIMVRRLRNRRVASLAVARATLASLPTPQHETPAQAEAGASYTSSAVQYSVSARNQCEIPCVSDYSKIPKVHKVDKCTVPMTSKTEFK